eukprot:06043.XXX_201433_201609_1 [CDS] Oithona nana genome sequencing.
MKTGGLLAICWQTRKFFSKMARKSKTIHYDYCHFDGPPPPGWCLRLRQALTHVFCRPF